MTTPILVFRYENSVLKMQEMPFQRPKKSKIFPGGMPPDPPVSGHDEVTSVCYRGPGVTIALTMPLLITI